MPASFTNDPHAQPANYLSATTSTIVYKKTTEAMINNMTKATANGDVSIPPPTSSSSLKASNGSVAKVKANTTIDSRKPSIPLIERTDSTSSVVHKFTSKLRRQVTTDEVPPTKDATNITNALPSKIEIEDNDEGRLKESSTPVDQAIIDPPVDQGNSPAEDGSLFTEVHELDDKIATITDASTKHKPRSYKMAKHTDKTSSGLVKSNDHQSNDHPFHSIDSIQLLEKDAPLLPVHSSSSTSSLPAADHDHHKSFEIKRKPILTNTKPSRVTDPIGRLRGEDILFDDSSMSIISGVTFDNQ